MTRPKCVGNKRTHESQRPPSDTFQNSKLRDDSSHNDAASSYLSPNKHDKLEGKNNIDKQRVFFFASTSYQFWVPVSWDFLLFEVSPTVKEASSHNGPPFENAKQKWQDQRAAGQPRCDQREESTFVEGVHANLVEKIELFLSAEIAQVETLEQARALEGLSTLDQLFHLLL